MVPGDVHDLELRAVIVPSKHVLEVDVEGIVHEREPPPDGRPEVKQGGAELVADCVLVRRKGSVVPALLHVIHCGVQHLFRVVPADDSRVDLQELLHPLLLWHLGPPPGESRPHVVPLQDTLHHKLPLLPRSLELGALAKVPELSGMQTVQQYQLLHLELLPLKPDGQVIRDNCACRPAHHDEGPLAANRENLVEVLGAKLRGRLALVA
mmetsp:Transcript_9744/g.33637  ORF Transcript_9744/g.33637 Transcript_9744/m.33637 type:complete len:209 (+) Transcript_9744:848-1474(+)